MQLSDAASTLTLSVTGYQFPDAVDPARRYSWHVVAGSVACPEGSWAFTYPALTCDETPKLSGWLRAAADRLDQVVTSIPAQPPLAPLTFTEPNLALALVKTPAGSAAAIAVDLDQEFHPHYHPGTSPFTLSLTIDPDRLRAAADEWDEERQPYPDLYPYPEDYSPRTEN